LKTSRYTLSDETLNDISLKDLAKRTKYGGAFYLLSFLAVVSGSSAAQEHMYVITLVSSCFFFLFLYRIVMCHRVFARKNEDVGDYSAHYTVIYSASAAVWVASSAWLFYVNPMIDLAVTVNMTASVGLSIGGVTVLAVSYKIMRTYLIIFCFPLAIAAGVLLSEPANLIFVTLILAFGLFVFLTGKQQNQAYWQALNDNLKLSEQAEELEKAKIAAERAGQAKADFLAAMSHEIRTPMNGVLGMAQLLAMGDLNEKQQQQVTVINNAGRTLMHIINNILDYSKINAEQIKLEKIEFSPRNVVNEVMLLLTPQFEKKPVKLTCIVADIPELVQGDPYRLHQILYNLVGNAFKFTHEGEISIEVSSKESHDENTVILSFAIRDTGIGISNEDRHKIFEQFYQVSHFNPNIRGTGLGLSITQRLVQLMGGIISVQSEEGKGSAFTVELPFMLNAESPFSSASIYSEQVMTKRESLSDLHILLVEDNKINQMICEQFFLKLGCSVDLAETGVDAIEKFKSEAHYDVIFMDCNMPEMDGFLATAAIRDIEKQAGLSPIPIVALTAHVEDSIRRQCLKAGMDMFLSKPFLFEDLEVIVSKIRTSIG
jgi:two-component system, sensor histidine kinase